jgi:hypothetical protein
VKTLNCAGGASYGAGVNETPRVTVTDIAEEERDGSREWCFLVRGLDETVQAARFRTKREAERAHQRFKRGIELLGHQLGR